MEDTAAGAPYTVVVGKRATLLLLAVSALQAQPRIHENGAVNAASFLSPITPGGALARGSIFSVFGENLGPRGLEAQELPLPTTLGGVEVLIVTGAGESFRAPLLFVGANQINAILPSDVPVGRHLLRVQRDGAPSNDRFIKVVQASFGLFFSDEQGVPVAAAQANTEFFTRRIGLGTPARPGDTVTLWGSGLGPAAGPDDRPPPAVPSDARIEVLLAGRPAAFTYAGRSACCAGLDQINVEIPPDAPPGCVVPLALRVNGNVSNHVALPMSADGSPCDRNLSFRAGRLELVRQWTGDAAADRGGGRFDRPLTPLDPMRLPPAGSCMVWPRIGDSGSPWLDASSFAALKLADDAGTVSLTTPAGTIEIPAGAIHATGAFLGPGAYFASAAGGEDFPPFQGALQINPAPVLESIDPTSVFARSTPASVRWFGGDPAAVGVFWSGQGPAVVCRADVAGGQFEVPAYVWANELSGARLFAFGAVRAAELMLPTEGPDHGLMVYREELLRSGDLGAPHLASTPVTLPSGAKIQAELAVTASERARGLMQRPSLDPDKGMLFVFEADGFYSFWMLNTLTPLDIVWMNADREILFINADTPPCRTQICPTFGPSARSRYVFELAAGEAARRGLKAGDRLDW